MIQRQVEHMRDIARDFYAFAGEHKEPCVFDPAEIADEVLELNSGWAQHQSVRMQRSGTGAPVFGDPAQLRRALVNLVSNALEAMPDGGELKLDVSSRNGRSSHQHEQHDAISHGRTLQ